VRGEGFNGGRTPFPDGGQIFSHLIVLGSETGLEFVEVARSLLSFRGPPMTAILLSLAVVSLVAVAGLAASAVAGHQQRVDPFLPGVTDPSADTLHGEAAVQTVFLEPRWQSTVVSSLGRATDILDSLEAHGVRDREVVTLADERFLVRWR